MAIVAAHAADVAAEQDFLQDVPMVLSASRLRQPLDEVPVTMSVIDRAAIDASAVRTVADLLRLVPGMYVGHGHGVEGIVPVVSYHGLTDEFSRRMQVLVDGRSVYTPLFGTVLWDDLPLAIDDIERIEITRGPNSASYGANAFFGAINIITRAPTAGDGGLALARGGQAGTREALLRLAGATGPLNYRLTLGRKQGEEFINVYDAQHHDYLSGSAELALGNRDSVELQGGFSQGARNQGFTDSLTDRPRTKTLDAAFMQSKWRRAWSSGDELTLQYAFQRQGWNEFDQTLPLPLPGVPLQSYAVQGSVHFDQHDLELQRISQLSDVLRVVWGAGARLDRIDAPIYFGGNEAESTRLARVFAHAEWRVRPDLLWQLGAMAERTTISGSDFSPRVSATYHVDGTHSLRASLSKAYRTPLLYEERGNYAVSFGPFRDQIALSTGGLHSEQMVSVEVGYHGQWLNPAVTADVKLYRDRASRLIDSVDIPIAQPNALRYYATDPQNGSDAVVTGIETELHVPAGKSDRLWFAYAYTVIASNDLANHLGLEKSMPRNLLSVLATHAFGGGWNAGAAFYLNSSLTPLGAHGVVPLARRLDAHLDKSLELWGRAATLSGGVQDALGSYVDFRTDNVFTRRIYLEARARL